MAAVHAGRYRRAIRVRRQRLGVSIAKRRNVHARMIRRIDEKLRQTRKMHERGTRDQVKVMLSGGQYVGVGA